MRPATGKKRISRQNAKKSIVELGSQDDFVRKYMLLDEIPVGIYFNDMNGKFLYGNRKAEQITGLDREKVIGSSITQLKIVDMNDIGRAIKLLAMLKAGKACGPETFNLKKPDGSEAVVEISSYPLMLEEKRISLNIIIDVTKRSYIESELKKSEALYRNLTESISDMIYIIDKDNCVLFVNSASEKGFNAKKNELICRSVDTLFPMELTKFHAKNVREVFRTGKPAFCEIHENFKGSDRWLDVRLFPLKVPSGETESVIGIAHDITVRKRAQNALVESEKKYREFVDNAIIGVYKTTMKGEVLFANEALQKMLEFPKFEEMQKLGAISRYKDAADRERLIKELGEKGKVESFETSLVTRSGKVRFVIMSAVADGEFISGMIMDNTERNIVQQQLKEKVEELERFNRIAVGRELKMVELKKRLRDMEGGGK